jgi:hypothetical protein
VIPSAGPTKRRLFRPGVAPPWVVAAAWFVVAVQGAAAVGVLAARVGAPERPPVPAAVEPDRGVHAADDPEASARQSALAALLVRRASALQTRDRAAFLAGVDPGTPFRARQARVFDALADVPLSGVSYDLDPARALELPAAAAERYGDPTWAAAVRFRYALDGYDDAPTAQEHYLTFVQRGSRWYLASDTDFESAGQSTARGLWDFGPVVALRTTRVLVLGHPTSVTLMRRILTAADAAVPRVTAVWPHWSGRVVVLVPDSTDQLRRMVAHTGDLSRIAAVASADVGVDGGPPAGERIAVNPGPFRSLSGFGRGVVLRHEIAHVATRDVTSGATPYWLAEGFADYVGYRGSGTTIRDAARELAAEVAAGKVPKRLPTEADFAGDNRRLAQAYEMSWLACRLLAARLGQAGLVAFYREVSTTPGDPDAAFDAALRARLDMGTAEFVAAWQARLRRELG